jgi:indolepyruvate ferredoxin oxidoreductase
VRAGLARIAEARRADNAPDLAARLPYFCSGCPHNTSTKVPDGSRAYAGIGCHIMALWMDRETSGYTHMGGEGANWIGEAPFSTTGHVFQNLGDGTYNHSGLMAIRAAVAAGVNITYKILYNDAVAMTGGQHNDGDLKADQIARELQAMGVKDIALVFDPKEEIDRSVFPKGLQWHERDALPQVQEKFRDIKGVSAIIFVQTCAAEKRRRRKRGQFPDPDRRVFINTDVCEGCGDCGVQSNCVSIVPVETELGRKRAIDQSSCNKDFSCLKGFCPSFVTVEGAKIRKEATATVDIGHLPAPALPAIDGTWNVVITGVGGTGVVTIGAILAMAAHLDGKGAGMMEMAGLAQKGGAVHIHCRLAETPGDISAIRVATGEADALIGGDLVVSAGAKTLGLTRRGRTGAVVNSHEIITGAFTRDTEFRIPGERLALQLQGRLGDAVALFDASELARALMGDSIFSNMMVFGAAWQRGLIPLSEEAILKAIELNGAAAEKNQRAFEIGRWAALNPDEAARIATPNVVEKPKTLDEAIAFREAHLRDYQGARLAKRYRRLVDRASDPVLKEAVAKGYHKLLAYKDEYEVARLHLETEARARETFDGDFILKYHLAPPLLPGRDAEGRPKKREFGPWMGRVYPVLAGLRRLRGTPLDPFGYTAERKMERGLIRQYEADMAEFLPRAGAAAPDALVALAELPLAIRGFGPVKERNAEKAARQREDLVAMLRAGSGPMAQAAE